ncbi:MAG: hypothetical protein GY909_03150 [Oligoflexia bacterium]|nr:hypothetical protein [Oligoflexia bacterium]
MNAKEFLKIADQFKLGELDTEKSNPQTIGLSDQVKLNLKEAISNFKKVDLHALEVLKNSFGLIEELHDTIKEVTSNSGRVFLCGCGATGRLSLALETISYQVGIHSEKVISFMAGGDVALIRSIEKFEDYPEYGERQLLDLGFTENDLLIAITEGGETPFVIGACEKAASISKHTPYFCYCNPDEILNEKVIRSKNVILNDKIKKINLSHGAQALSGSTRLQCSTVLMAAVGCALFEEKERIRFSLEHLHDYYAFLDCSFLENFIKEEAKIYQKGEYISYCPDLDFSLDVLTDTTERSPTFSLTPFENYHVKEDETSWSYLLLSDFADAKSAWHGLLKREPRVLEWEETKDKTGRDRLLGFDFSRKGASLRAKRVGSGNHLFLIKKNNDLMTFQLNSVQSFIDLKNVSSLNQHLILKMLLNMHSTLLMGLMERYQSNIMVWVKASNNKLIDRSARYIIQLLKEKNIDVSYENVVHSIFEYKDKLKSDESIVKKVIQVIENC